MAKILPHYKQVKKKCVLCLKEFFIFPYREKQAMFCSNKCRGQSLKGKSISPSTQIKKGQRLSPKTEFKGNSKSYHAIHAWIKRKLGKAYKCEWCSGDYGKFEWANKSHEYNRNVEDYVQLCVMCHRNYDKTYRKNKPKK